MRRTVYQSPTTLQEVEIRLERDLLQNSIVADDATVGVHDFESVTFTDAESGFETNYFDAEFK